MDKSPEAFRTISEVAEALDVPPHVLRFWETRFAQVKPVKRGGGRRYYRPEDVRLLRGIRGLLYDDGMTIKGVQKILRERGIRHVIGLGTEPERREPSPAARRRRRSPPASAGREGAGAAAARRQPPGRSPTSSAGRGETATGGAAPAPPRPRRGRRTSARCRALFAELQALRAVMIDDSQAAAEPGARFPLALRQRPAIKRLVSGYSAVW